MSKSKGEKRKGKKRGEETDESVGERREKREKDSIGCQGEGRHEEEKMSRS